VNVREVYLASLMDFKQAAKRAFNLHEISEIRLLCFSYVCESLCTYVVLRMNALRQFKKKRGGRRTDLIVKQLIKINHLTKQLKQKRWCFVQYELSQSLEQLQ